MTLSEDWLDNAHKILTAHLKGHPSSIEPNDVVSSLVAIETLQLVKELKEKIEAMEASLEFNELRLRVKAAVEEDEKQTAGWQPRSQRRDSNVPLGTTCPNEASCKWRMLNFGAGAVWMCEHGIKSFKHPNGYCDQGCCR